MAAGRAEALAYRESNRATYTRDDLSRVTSASQPSHALTFPMNRPGSEPDLSFVRDNLGRVISASRPAAR